MKNILLFAILVTVAIGCKKSSEFPENFSNKIADKQFTLVPSGTIEIPVDSVTQNYSNYPVYYLGDTAEYYICGNDNINSVDFYDLKKKKLVRRNIYEKEGAGGVQSTLKIYLTSLDSIYIYSDKKILLTNFAGEILGIYPLSTECCPMVYWLSPLVVRNGHAFLGHMAKGDNRDQMGHRSMLRGNLTTGKFSEYGPKYPTLFHQYLYDSFMPSYAFGHDGHIVVRFGALSDLYVYDTRNDSTSVVPMQSQFQLSPILPDKNASQAMDIEEKFRGIVQTQYSGVFYDAYHRLYYSLFYHGLPLYDSAGYKSDFEDKPVSIIIFNEDFEYCGEVKLKEKTYRFNSYLCSRQGLLIPTSHSKNPNNNEDILRFEIFKPQPVK